MSIKRREFIRLSAGNAALLYGLPVGLAGAAGIPANANGTAGKRSGVLDQSRSMTGDVSPITLEERRMRIQKAQRLMGENKIQAIVLDAGTSMVYFTGMTWGASERPMLAIIPAHGDVKYVSPAFEAERLRELKEGAGGGVWRGEGRCSV
jgi:Xaa-Pro dipeptidase